MNWSNMFALCETNLDNSIDSGNFSVRDYLPGIWKDSITHMHGLAVYVKECLPFGWDVSRNLCGLLLMFATGFTSLSFLFVFSLLITFVIMHNFLFYFI